MQPILSGLLLNSGAGKQTDVFWTHSDSAIDTNDMNAHQLYGLYLKRLGGMYFCILIPHQV